MWGSVLFGFYQCKGSVWFEFFARTENSGSVRIRFCILSINSVWFGTTWDRRFDCFNFPLMTAEIFNTKLLQKTVSPSYYKRFHILLLSVSTNLPKWQESRMQGSGSVRVLQVYGFDSVWLELYTFGHIRSSFVRFFPQYGL